MGLIHLSFSRSSGVSHGAAVASMGITPHACK
jgi:hypothetical protein